MEHERELSARPSRPRLVVLLALVGCVASSCLSDVRSASLRAGVGVTREGGAAARKALVRAAERQGFAAWRRTPGEHLTLQDRWPSGVAAWFAVPWAPGDPFELEAVRGSQAGLLRLTRGDEAGCEHVRRADGSTAYVDAAGVVREVEGDELTDFFLPAIRYLADFPFRILEAELFAPAGEAPFGGRVFDRYLATWKSLAPNSEFDQYVVWVARDTGRVEVIEYTSRAEFRFSHYGTVFDQFERVDGVELPRRITIVSELAEDCMQNYLHRFVVEEREFTPVSIPPRQATADAGPGR